MSSKFLALSDAVRTGSTVELPKYLVEVGEPWTEGMVLFCAVGVWDYLSFSFLILLNHQLLIVVVFNYIM